ncbi:hypothetical protein GCM10017688_28520 [Streptomyces ramulosus]
MAFTASGKSVSPRQVAKSPIRMERLPQSLWSDHSSVGPEAGAGGGAERDAGRVCGEGYVDAGSRGCRYEGRPGEAREARNAERP